MLQQTGTATNWPNSHFLITKVCIRVNIFELFFCWANDKKKLKNIYSNTYFRYKKMWNWPICVKLSLGFATLAFWQKKFDTLVPSFQFPELVPSSSKYFRAFFFEHFSNEISSKKYARKFFEHFSDRLSSKQISSEPPRPKIFTRTGN